ncbi:unnamed protein product [Prorocentrum cordatum]|uniref:Secreted protein n=1 Tax=Prorocentrum cordatum TaxID=2364126 RepID=A0ABN9PUC8_9DINO|nr:unnamed protein product [Polarella glacialis]
MRLALLRVLLGRLPALGPGSALLPSEAAAHGLRCAGCSQRDAVYTVRLIFLCIMSGKPRHRACATAWREGEEEERSVLLASLASQPVLADRARAAAMRDI